MTATATNTIGAILVDAGKLSPESAERILRLQKEKNIRFGEAALQLNLLTPEELDQAFARQYNYPYLLEGEARVSTKLAAAYQPFSPEVETLRALRSQLMLRWFSNEANRRTLAVVSAEPGCGRSHLVANLAIIFSQLGERTLLIDADLRNPCQHLLMGEDNRIGLSSILSRRAGHEAIRGVPELAALDLLAAGPQPPNPQELLGQPTFAELLAGLGERYDVILIDTPAAAASADAQIVAARAGAALIVARKHAGSLGATRHLAERLADTGTNLVGSVLTEL